ncbi:hypothetical protein, partial [Pseudonocardia ailaonensis]|uniref:hypothetical protein n=1 Tax=Pseudonocardia ailaonensis TaxID=367279 RepID=UPI0031D1128B
KDTRTPSPNPPKGHKLRGVVVVLSVPIEPTGSEATFLSYSSRSTEASPSFSGAVRMVLPEGFASAEVVTHVAV